MAIIYSYPQITPKADDLLIISDVSDGQKPTKTASIADVLSLASGGGGGLSGSGATGQVTFWTSTSGISGSNGFFFNSTTERVGIGTTAPVTPLHMENGGFPQITLNQTDAVTGSAIAFTERLGSSSQKVWNVGLSPSPTSGVFKISAGSFNSAFDAVTIRPNSSGVSSTLMSSTLVVNDTTYNNSSSSADPSAVLEAKSTTKGFLPPRVTTSQRTSISSPAEGLVVYDTDFNSLYLFSNSAWVEINGGSTGSNIYSSSITPTSLEIPTTIGGFTAGTSAQQLNDADRTLSQMFDVLLFPTVQPTFTNPSATLTSSFANGALFIIGTSQTFTLTTGINFGTLSNANGSPFTGYVDPAGPYAGNVQANPTVSGPNNTSYNITVTGAYPASILSNPSISLTQYSGAYPASGNTVVEGDNTWTLTMNLNQGPSPVVFPSGDIDNTNRYNGGVVTKSIKLEGVYPYFLGTSTSSTSFSQAALVSFSNGTSINNGIQCNQNYDETDTVRHRIELPTDMVDGRTIQVWEFREDVEEYQLPNVDTWTEDTTQLRTIGTVAGVPYTRLTKNGDIGGPVNYRVVFV